MLSFLTRAPRARRTLIFGSTMHIWSDLFSLDTTMIVMGVATAAILPASLTLRKHLSPNP